jgi:hypothetical protein
MEVCMKSILTSSLSTINEGRVLVPILNNNDVDWVDAAELAQSVGITTEQYPGWLNSMYEMGAITVSDTKTL